MTKDELWYFLVSKNKSFGKDEDQSVSLTIKNIKKFFDFVYKEAESCGYDRGIRVSKDLKDLNQKSAKPPSDFDGIFGNIFR